MIPMLPYALALFRFFGEDRGSCCCQRRYIAYMYLMRLCLSSFILEGRTVGFY